MLNKSAFLIVHFHLCLGRNIIDPEKSGYIYSIQ